MIEFRLNHTLQLQFDSLLTRLCKGFVSKDVYVLTDNLLIALGRPFSIAISLLDGEIIYENPYEEWDVEELDKLTIIKEESVETEIFRYLIMRLRVYYSVVPYATEHMLDMLKRRVSERLRYYNITIYDTIEGISILELLLSSVKTSMEEIFRYLTKEELSGIEDILKDVDLSYGSRLKSLLRYEEALKIYMRALELVDEKSIHYTEFCFEIGEILYQLNELENSVEYYSRCNTSYLKDTKDYYIRLGHSLTDNNMKESGEFIKYYYRGILNPNIINVAPSEYEKVRNQIGTKFDEYELMCEKVGREYIK